MRQLTEKSGLELIEEATHLLRLAPPAALASYYLGTLPFVLGLLYFWSDMSRGALAERRLAGAALGLAVLFVWMKSWQAAGAHRWLVWLCGEPAPRWGPKRVTGLALGQAITQPWGLFLLPVSLVLMAPFGWLYAFQQNLNVLAGSEPESVRRLVKRAWRQACLWPGQNHAVLMILPLFGLVVFVNLFAAAVAAPWLLDRFLGIPTPFTRSPWTVLNTTFMAAVAALSHLCVAPLFKAVYVLRCFYGDSLRSGADLKAELRRWAAAEPALPDFRTPSQAGWANQGAAASSRTTAGEQPTPHREVTRGPNQERAGAGWPGLVAGLVLALNLAGALGAAGAAPVVPAPSAAPPSGLLLVSPAELDPAIDRALERPEFLWRLPREHAPREQREAGWLDALLAQLGDALKAAAQAVGRWLDQVIRWIRRWLWPDIKVDPTPGDWTGPLRALVVVLLAGLVGVLGWLLFRLWQQHRRRAASVVAAQPLAPAPDLADESVGPDQLPEDGWTRLARAHAARGELRLALRAWYLASLAHLGARGLVVLARFKSNLDYVRELGRRAHALPEVAAVFERNVGIFDRVWYGLHEVNGALLEEFAGNVERMRRG